MPNNKQSFIQISLVVFAFIAGWFSHQLAQPFFGTTKTAQPGQLLDDKIVIFQAPDTASHRQQQLRIDTVTLLQHSEDAVLLELKYHYNAPAPAQEVKLFVGMYSKYLYLGSAQVQQGDGIARIQIGLNDSDMHKDGIRNFRTESMQISFEHYAPDAYKGVLASTVLPFNKDWSLKSQ